jgi:hypothetical protein
LQGTKQRGEVYTDVCRDVSEPDHFVFIKIQFFLRKGWNLHSQTLQARIARYLIIGILVEFLSSILFLRLCFFVRLVLCSNILKKDIWSKLHTDECKRSLLYFFHRIASNLFWTIRLLKLKGVVFCQIMKTPMVFSWRIWMYVLWLWFSLKIPESTLQRTDYHYHCEPQY